MRTNLDNPAAVRENPSRAWRMMFSFILFAVLSVGAEVARAQQTIRYAGDQAFRSFEWSDENGRAQGFQIDLLEAISKATNTPIDVHLGPWSDVYQEMLDGKRDLTAMCVTEDRKKLFVFCDPHATEGTIPYMRSGFAGRVLTLEELNGKRVGVQASGMSDQELVRRGIEPKELRRYPSEADALRALADGEVDFIVISEHAGRVAIRDLGLADRVVSAGPALTKNDYSFATLRGREDVVATVNRGLELIRKSGEYDRIYAKWFVETDPSQVRRRLFLWVTAVSGPLLILSVGYYLWSRTLKERVGIATAELRRELTHRMETEQKLRTSDERFRLAIAGSRMAVANQDLDLRYIWTYDPSGMFRGRDLTGLTDRDILLNAIGPQSLPLIESLEATKRRVLENGKGEELDLAIPQTTASEQRVLNVMIEPLRDSSGTVCGVTSAVMDVTNARRSAEMRLELEGRAREVQKLESLGLLAGGVAHDMNNMLSVVSLSAQTLKNEAESKGCSEAARRALSDIEHIAAESKGLVSGLLAFSRRSAVSKVPVNLSVLVIESAALLRRVLPTNISVVHRGVEAGTTDLWVMADASQLQQVLMNLALNARDAMPNGGSITMRLRAERESMLLRGAENVVVLTVEDEGTGMPREVASRVFEPFFTTKASGKGTGLGLSIVHGVVTQHGGAITVDSSVGEGTVFTIVLRRIAAPTSARGVGGNSNGDMTHSGRVLVVHTPSMARTLMSSMLEEAGYAVQEVNDVKAAIEVIEGHRGEERLVVVVDDEDGAPVVEQRITDGVDRGMRVVELRSVASEAPSANPLVRVLRKPFRLHELLHRVEEAFELRVEKPKSGV